MSKIISIFKALTDYWIVYPVIFALWFIPCLAVHLVSKWNEVITYWSIMCLVILIAATLAIISIRDKYLSEQKRYDIADESHFKRLRY